MLLTTALPIFFYFFTAQFLVNTAFIHPVWAKTTAPQWTYVRADALVSSAPERGAMTVLTLSGESYVPAAQYCGSLGCRLTYQWDKQRLMIHNPRGHMLAIVSPLSSVAIAHGKVLHFNGKVLSTADQGYLLPVTLAVQIAKTIGIGKLLQNSESETIEGAMSESRTLKSVIIDAGHGGYDLGTSIGTLYEKDIALFYAIRLRDELKKRLAQVEVQLTRETDRYVSLGERARYANKAGAGLFISLHVNHSHDKVARGTETYILSPDATDSESRKTALLENESWVQNAKVGELPTSDGIKSIFVDLEQQKFIQDSALFAAYCQQEFARIDNGNAVKNRGVKQAFFYVLSQAAMPAALVEMGFLSNTQDRDKLMNSEFQKRFIDALITAIIRYRGKLDPNAK